MIRRYHELRRSGQPLSDEAVLAQFDRLTGELREAQARNFTVWRANPGLSDGLIPLVIPKYRPFVYNRVAADSRDWLLRRLGWLDRHIDEIPDRVSMTTAGFATEYPYETSLWVTQIESAR